MGNSCLKNYINKKNNFSVIYDPYEERNKKKKNISFVNKNNILISHNVIHHMYKDNNRKYKETINIFFYGSTNVGKTRFIKNLNNLENKELYNNEFSYEFTTSPTIGMEINIHFYINEKKNIYKLNLLDCAGDKKYFTQIDRYFKDAKIFIICMNQNNYKSFLDAGTYLHDLKRKINDYQYFNFSNKIKFYLLEIDDKNENYLKSSIKERNISQSEINNFCLQHNICYEKISDLKNSNSVMKNIIIDYIKN